VNLEKLSLALRTGSALLLVVFLVTARRGSSGLLQAENQPQFPFEVTYERKTGVGGPL
jgi:hypothetical protein